MSKTKQEMSIAEYKAVYIQKFKELTPKDDTEVIGLFKPFFLALYLQYFGYLQVAGQNCRHEQVTFVPVEARKPLYFGCEGCKVRVELNGGLSKGQIREAFKSKKRLSDYRLRITLCGQHIQIYHVVSLNQPTP